MRLFVVFGVLLVMLAGPVSAADLGGDDRVSYKDDSPHLAQFSWTGGYAGLQLGWADADTDARSGTAAAFNQSYGYDYSAVIGGGHIGYNLQAGLIVYGIEADFEFSDLDKISVGSLGDTHQTEINWFGSLRARLGVTPSQNALLYITGGWAFGEVEISNSAGPLAYSDIRSGWTLGAGYEYAFSRNMTARLEYRYTDLGSASLINAGLNARDESDVTIQAIRAGVSFKF